MRKKLKALKDKLRRVRRMAEDNKADIGGLETQAQGHYHRLAAHDSAIAGFAARLDRAEQGLGRAEDGLASAAKRICELEELDDGLVARVEPLEKLAKHVELKTNTLWDTMNNLVDRVHNIERLDLGAALGTLKAETLANFRHVHEKIDEEKAVADQLAHVIERLDAGASACGTTITGVVSRLVKAEESLIRLEGAGLGNPQILVKAVADRLGERIDGVKNRLHSVEADNQSAFCSVHERLADVEKLTARVRDKATKVEAGNQSAFHSVHERLANLVDAVARLADQRDHACEDAAKAEASEDARRGELAEAKEALERAEAERDAANVKIQQYHADFGEGTWIEVCEQRDQYGLWLEEATQLLITDRWAHVPGEVRKLRDRALALEEELQGARAEAVRLRNVQAELETSRAGAVDRNRRAIDIARRSSAPLRPDCNRVDHAMEDVCAELERSHAGQAGIEVLKMLMALKLNGKS